MLYGVIPIFVKGRRSRQPRAEVWGDLIVEMHQTSTVRTARLREHGTHHLTSIIPALHHVRLRRMQGDFLVLVGREGAADGPPQAWSCRYVNGFEYHASTVKTGIDNSALNAQFEHWWQDVLRLYVDQWVMVEDLKRTLKLPEDLFWQFLDWANLSFRGHVEGPRGAAHMHIHNAGRRLQLIEIKRQWGYGEPTEPRHVEFTDIR